MKKEKELLSVIVPVYNTEKYLQICIESILNQTYQNIELILVNDGSLDNSGKICEEYKEKDNRVKVFHKQNEGLINARLDGVRLAAGNYITFVDSDDWISLDTYKKAMAYTKDTDIVSFGMHRYFSENSISTDSYCLQEGKYDKKDIEEKIIPYMLWNREIGKWSLDPSLCSKIFKKKKILKYLEKIENLKIYYAEDVAVIYPMMLEISSFYNMHESFYYHRQRENGENCPYVEDKKFFDKLYRLYVYLREEFEKSAYFDCLEEQLEHYYINSIGLKRSSFGNLKEISAELFPYWRVKADTRVILYGAGVAGTKYKEQNDKYHFCDIVLWVDKASERYDNSGRPQTIERIKETEYDYIIVAVKSASLAYDIRKKLIHMGVSQKKIVWNAVRIEEIMEEA